MSRLGRAPKQTLTAAFLVTPNLPEASKLAAFFLAADRFRDSSLDHARWLWGRDNALGAGELHSGFETAESMELFGLCEPVGLTPSCL